MKKTITSSQGTQRIELSSGGAGVKIVVVDVKKNRQNMIHVFDESIDAIIHALLQHRHERKISVGEVDGAMKSV